MTQKTALVVGANGGIGQAVTRQMLESGWQVNAFARRENQPSIPSDNIHPITGDAMKCGDVCKAARGCSAIIHAVNPPGYKNWDRLVLPMLENTIQAAKQAGATIVLPGTLYNYGPDAFPVIDEDTPQHPNTRKGQLRVQMEQRLKTCAKQGNPVIVVRAGDFFGPDAGNNWFSQGLLASRNPAKTLLNPAMPGISHQWSYLPDVAETIVRLLEIRTQLKPFENIHMAGHQDISGTDMVHLIGKLMAKHSGNQPGIKPFPWWLFRLLSPFSQTMREISEVRYLWRHSAQMRNRRLIELLGTEPHTPLAQAVEDTLLSLTDRI
ncbi:short chain dehydrogenase [Vibrio aerogenes CECT 7868]|uniref:Short chain dehydrogenase n=1 Tax=Vibrio aerogenes CECT 7868 TaxID=1216006 RepID=A0A1M5ZT66_9VIBR|nr:NAD(P)H-binding protein [Vibrio aerogenes]SHI27123.1 short chain dehydrogenase [Vibrio aerogenes CECT 7868]